MFNLQNIKNFSELRSNPAEVMRLAKDSEAPVYIFNRSKPVSVVLDIALYEALVDKLEDTMDALEVKKQEKQVKDKTEWISHDDLAKKLGIKV